MLKTAEAPTQCTARDLVEETGYKTAKITRLTDLYTIPGIRTEGMWSYPAESLAHVTQNLDGGEEDPR